jgi:hypothetical protein
VHVRRCKMHKDFAFRFPDQLKVFFVGGPNDRKDFHLEEGEEVIISIVHPVYSLDFLSNQR